MIAIKIRKTVTDYLALPVQPRVELMEGEFFMSPAPDDRHQIATLNVASKLDAHVRRAKSGRVFVSPFDCVLSEGDVAQPDVLFVATENLGKIRRRLYGAPDLAVEVLSPESAVRDRIVKRDLYARVGVREYWIIDPDGRAVEVMTLERGAYRLHTLFGVGDLLDSPLLGRLNVPVTELFE